jgi:hypothetical protein
VNETSPGSEVPVEGPSLGEAAKPAAPPLYPPEVWLRGPLIAVPPYLQPVAHSLLQCREEVHALLARLTVAQMTDRPNGAASISYHLRHAVGSLDRLLTYARGEQLSEEHLDALAREKNEDPTPHLGLRLRALFDGAVERALAQVRATPEAVLLDVRLVGRAHLPSTVIGLLFHAAEHTQRHVGQAVTTAKILSG